MRTKPYAEACDQNRAPILAVIRPYLAAAGRLLEIASGTGQHAVYFGEALPHVQWQTSDRRDCHAGIALWLHDAGLDNVLPPLALDVRADPWPAGPFDTVFSANSAHIMHEPEVEAMFAGVGRVLRPNGVFLLYGPFNYQGRYTSASNARFDQWLKARDAASGIRDVDWLSGLAADAGLAPDADYEMPVNNRILVWRKIPAQVNFAGAGR